MISNAGILFLGKTDWCVKTSISVGLSDKQRIELIHEYYGEVDRK